MRDILPFDGLQKEDIKRLERLARETPDDEITRKRIEFLKLFDPDFDPELFPYSKGFKHP